MTRRALAVVLALLGAVTIACAPDAPERPRAGDGSRAPARAGEGADADPVPFQLFDEVPAPDLERRLTLHLLVPADAERQQLSRTLREVLTERSVEDTTLVAIRAIAYQGEMIEGERDAHLVPVAWAEWIPLEGWWGNVESGRGRNHRVYFYTAPPPW